MTYINNKSNYFPNVVTREEQSEITQQTSAEQPQVNTGIANTTDIFESARPSDLIQQQTSPQTNVELQHSQNQSIETFALFNYLLNMQDQQQLAKAISKDLINRFTDAVNEGQKTDEGVQRAIDDSDTIRKAD